MGIAQYHDPGTEVPETACPFARMITSLIEETEALSWAAQRIALEQAAAARALMLNAEHEEFKHCGMDLEFLLRRTPKWRWPCKISSSAKATSSPTPNR
jgi:uncharacterized protein